MTSLRKSLEEIHLLRYSLLPGELLEFTDQAALWNELLDAYALDPDCEIGCEPQGAHFRVKLEASSDVWFDVELPTDYWTAEGKGQPRLSAQGDNLGRAQQERWQEIVADAATTVRVQDSEYPLYEMISSHLLPQLHIDLEEQANATAAKATEASASSGGPSPSPRYHALFVSHHLKSPQKRRALSQWSHELSLVGFAKVGYPGVIYCEGAQEDVEDFVERVKSMQWLALRLRFIESAPPTDESQKQDSHHGRWSEFEKVGEVVEEMRRLGREQFVVEMGLGSAGNARPSK
ncbi:hypothetical protein DICSQDRAFT_165165 [Dichomitus squalens LYAD-421 SS1]|uniref:Small nuclear ribonucleoprotein Prp3 C-terminal domain-containing protein n=1 Tax=Dichomitus squalens TaxID=114155 RepID=A0A4Q9Q5C4_9APHY|nr:uncharacterized protein DICSQDRAFT_165165 [Dichomitus squalens LYAD-421 SS1]EJF67342.1 hypothetical protein DICSQDRAFT_165165 [Dichomitus squalens LYAD-421 SS1]TBU62479.1 hypothetical protein BD310DRAFT_843433 [Dichomitus squalens]